MDFISIAENFFCQEELEAIRSLHLSAQVELFFRIWTCKEAYLKAKGTGPSAAVRNLLGSLGSRAGKASRTDPCAMKRN